MGVLLLAAAAVGFGIGFLASKPKINAARAETEEVRTQLQNLELQSQAKQRAADDEIAKLRAELMRTRNDLTRANTDLIKARTDLAQMKTALEQMAASGSASQPAAEPDKAVASVSSPTAPSTSAPAAASPVAAAPSPSSPSPTSSSAAPAGTREYVIKEGDSLWKIAATQLGNGTRYKEILQLNPHLSPNKSLEVGSKIRIPAK